MKKISIVIPCLNEAENVPLMAFTVDNLLKEALAGYDYEILFIDNYSTDGTREELEQICKNNPKVKAIFNVTDFGQFNSPFYAMCQATGDCVVCMCCDFQDPADLIPRFVGEWEKGHRIVSGVKTSSRENKFVYFLRTLYYKTIKNMSAAEMIAHFTGFGLYDRSFIDILRQLDDPVPFLRGIVAEYGRGFNRIEIAYEQEKRRAGKTHNSFYSLYDAAMLSFTSYTKAGLRLATFLGFAASAASLCVAFYYLVYKLTHWYTFQAGNAPMVVGIFLLGSVQLFFIGLLGEYILNINTRVIHRPLVIEEKRLNFMEKKNEVSGVENKADGMDGKKEAQCQNRTAGTDGTKETVCENKTAGTDGTKETVCENKTAGMDGTKETVCENKTAEMDGTKETVCENKTAEMDGTKETVCENKTAGMDQAGEIYN